MKTNPKTPGWMVVSAAFLVSFWMMGTTKVFAEVEIDLDEASKPTPVSKVNPIPTPVSDTHKMPIETQAPVPPKEVVPVQQPMDTSKSETEPADEKEEVEVDETSDSSEIVHGTVKMKDVYEAGVKYYKEKDYDEAIRFFTKAVGMKDKYTPKFYYAEAYAMMGVIYQFCIIRYPTAYNYYKKALKYEPRNETARKHIKEVAKHLRKGR